ncbi:hypothetical protein TNCV_4636521 [Trichonephila clavipes]|nr:hypothetical protein TNCV_4636521 [Trichonephila clavipes]
MQRQQTVKRLVGEFSRLQPAKRYGVAESTIEGTSRDVKIHTPPPDTEDPSVSFRTQPYRRHTLASVETLHEGHSGARSSKQQMPRGSEASMTNAKTSQFDISSSHWHHRPCSYDRRFTECSLLSNRLSP